MALPLELERRLEALLRDQFTPDELQREATFLGKGVELELPPGLAPGAFVHELARALERRSCTLELLVALRRLPRRSHAELDALLADLRPLVAARRWGPGFRELRELLATRAPLLYSGELLPSSAAIPSRRDLIARLADDVADSDQRAAIDRRAREGRLADAFRLLEAELGKPLLRQRARKAWEVSIDAPLSPLATALTALRPRLRAALTTNLDYLVDRAFTPWPVLAEPVADLAQRGEFVLKLHGTLPYTDGWALTPADLPMYRDPAHAALFDALALGQTLVFVGAARDDAALAWLGERLRAARGAPPQHFAVLRREHWDDAERDALRDLGITVVACDGEDGETRLLQELAA